MMDELRPDRKSRRLGGFDYGQEGAYFFTLCIIGRDECLATIQAGSVVLSPFGEIAERIWQKLPDRFEKVTLDEHVIMPNHFHGVFFIGPAMPIARPGGTTRFLYAAPAIEPRRPLRGTRPGSFSAVVQNFSSTTTRRINVLRESRGRRLWQSHGYDRIVRGEAELARIREYIRLNPARWEEDPENERRVGPATELPLSRE